MDGSLESLSDVLKSDFRSASSRLACFADNVKLEGWKDFELVRKVRFSESA
jgi:hypothetical protein